MTFIAIFFQLRVLDFRRIRLRERELAKKLFKSKLGKDIQKEAKKTKTFVPGGGILSESRPQMSKIFYLIIEDIFNCVYDYILMKFFNNLFIFKFQHKLI